MFTELVDRGGGGPELTRVWQEEGFRIVNVRSVPSSSLQCGGTEPYQGLCLLSSPTFRDSLNSVPMLALFLLQSTL